MGTPNPIETTSVQELLDVLEETMERISKKKGPKSPEWVIPAARTYQNISSTSSLNEAPRSTSETRRNGTKSYCTHYLKGKCHFGEGCHHSHEIPDNATLDSLHIKFISIKCWDDYIRNNRSSCLRSSDELSWPPLRSAKPKSLESPATSESATHNTITKPAVSAKAAGSHHPTSPSRAYAPQARSTTVAHLPAPKTVLIPYRSYPKKGLCVKPLALQMRRATPSQDAVIAKPSAVKEVTTRRCHGFESSALQVPLTPVLPDKTALSKLSSSHLPPGPAEPAARPNPSSPAPTTEKSLVVTATTPSLPSNMTTIPQSPATEKAIEPHNIPWAGQQLQRDVNITGLRAYAALTPLSVSPPARASPQPRIESSPRPCSAEPAAPAPLHCPLPASSGNSKFLC